MLKNALAIPKLQCVLRLRASPAYLCREELRVFDRALFGSLGRVADVSLEGEVCKKAGMPVNFGGLGGRRARYISLPSFLYSMNSVAELVVTNFSRINITELTIFQRLWSVGGGASGGASLPDDPKRQKPWDLPIVKKNWDNMLLDLDQVSRARLMATTQKESGAWLNALPVSSLGTLLDSESFRVANWPSPSEWALMSVFLILAAAGRWTVEVCMACPANTVLAAFQGI